MNQICDLYHDDRQAFDNLVKEAKEMCEAITENSGFWDWLTQKSTSEQLLRLQAGYRDLNSCGCNGKPLSRPLDKITDPFELQRIQGLLDHDVVFRFKYRRMLEPMQEVFAEYTQYRLFAHTKKRRIPQKQKCSRMNGIIMRSLLKLLKIQ